MGPWVIPAVSAGASLLESILGRKGKVERGLSPEAQEYLRMLYGELEGGAPSYLTAPIKARWGTHRQSIREGTGEALGVGSGPEMGLLKQATAGEGREMGEATERRRAGILRAIQSIVGGTGVQTGTAPFSFGQAPGDLGVAFYYLLNKKKGKGEGGGYGGYNPQTPYRPGRERSISPSYAL